MACVVLGLKVGVGVDSKYSWKWHDEIDGGDGTGC